MLCSVYCEYNTVLKMNIWCADFALFTFIFHLWSCPEEEEEGKMSESDEDRRIAEAKASRIQKCQGVVLFLPLWELVHPEFRMNESCAHTGWCFQSGSIGRVTAEKPGVIWWYNVSFEREPFFSETFYIFATLPWVKKNKKNECFWNKHWISQICIRGR